MGARGSAWERVRAFALSLPHAYEDHPWGESVAKAGKKVFVFLGSNDDPAMTVKLDESHGQALMAPGAAPTGYGLGRSGWLTIPLRRGRPPIGVLTDWVEESYRLIAPKTMVQELDARRRSPKDPQAGRMLRTSGRGPGRAR